MKTTKAIGLLLIGVLGACSSPGKKTTKTTDPTDAGSSDAEPGDLADIAAAPDVANDVANDAAVDAAADMAPPGPTIVECDLGDALTTSTDSPVLSIGSIAVDDDLVYVVDTDFNLRRYRISGSAECGATLDATFGSSGIIDLDEQISDVELADDGSLYVATESRIAELDDGGSEIAGCDVPAVFEGQVTWGRGYGIETVPGTSALSVLQRAQSSSFRLPLDFADCTREGWTPQGFIDATNNRFERIHEYDGSLVVSWWENDTVQSHPLVLDPMGNTTTNSWSAALIDTFDPDYTVTGVVGCSSSAGTLCAAGENKLYVIDANGDVLTQRSLVELVGASGNPKIFSLAGDGRHFYASVNALSDGANLGRLYRIDADSVIAGSAP